MFIFMHLQARDPHLNLQNQFVLSVIIVQSELVL